MSSETMSEVFKLRDTLCYNYILQIQFIVFIMEMNQHRIWEQIPAEDKNKESLDGFKRDIKKRNPLNVHVEFLGHLYLI